MKPNIIGIAASCLVGTFALACDAGPDDDAMQRYWIQENGMEGVRAIDPEIVNDDFAAETYCDELELEAEALVAELNVCGASGMCRLVEWDDHMDSCLLPFQCYTAIGEDVSLDALVAEARSIDQAYTDQGCRPCVQAMCKPRTQLRGVCEGDLCAVEAAGIR